MTSRFAALAAITFSSSALAGCSSDLDETVGTTTQAASTTYDAARSYEHRRAGCHWIGAHLQNEGPWYARVPHPARVCNAHRDGRADHEHQPR